MSEGFKYFFPGVTEKDLVDRGSSVKSQGKFRPEFFRRFKLENVLGDLTEWPVHGSVMPVESKQFGNGVLLAPVSGTGVPCNVVAMVPSIEWMDTGMDYWIGWVRNQEPQPIDLQRRKLVPGADIAANDPRQWTVPIARCRRYPERVTMPMQYRFDPMTGAPVAQPTRDHASLWRLACELYDYFLGEEVPNDSRGKQWLASKAIEALQVNYRIGFAEVNAFAEMGYGLVNDQSAALFCGALLGFDILREAEKKSTIPSDGDRVLNGCDLPTGELTPAA